VLGAGDSWVELCKRGILHGGDNDSTGTIAGALFGAMYGFKEIPECNYKVSLFTISVIIHISCITFF